MNRSQITLLFLLSVASFSCAQVEKEHDAEEQKVERLHDAELDELDMIGQEFQDFELEKLQEYKEPSRMQVWATAVGLALLIKYIEMRDLLSDWQETASEWWDDFLVFCYVKSKKTNEIDESNKA